MGSIPKKSIGLNREFSIKVFAGDNETKQMPRFTYTSGGDSFKGDDIKNSKGKLSYAYAIPVEEGSSLPDIVEEDEYLR